MKTNIIISIFALFFLTAANAMVIETQEDFTAAKFTQVTEALKKRNLLEINEQEYAVVKDPPKNNSCYIEAYIETPYLIRQKQVDLIPLQATFLSSAAVLSENQQYVTLRYTSDYNPHWALLEAETVHKDNLYWHMVCSRATFHRQRTVNFLLQKIG